MVSEKGKVKVKSVKKGVTYVVVSALKYKGMVQIVVKRRLAKKLYAVG